MDEEFDFDGTQSRRSEAPVQIWDILSILVLILTIFLAGYFVLVFINPASSLNLLPPGGGLFANPISTATATPLQMEPTWTASPTLQVTPSNTPRPTITPLPTNTSFSLVPPTKTPRPSATPTKARAPYNGSFTQVDSTVIHPELACNWAGVGGTVVDANNSPVIGIVVVLRGTLNGATVDQTTVSGINKEYGPSGFEFVLGTVPVASEDTLYVQLVDQQSIALSDPVQITTSTECNKNLVMVRFKRNR
jgi:hypothetical protein